MTDRPHYLDDVPSGTFVDTPPVGVTLALGLDFSWTAKNLTAAYTMGLIDAAQYGLGLLFLQREGLVEMVDVPQAVDRTEILPTDISVS